VKPRERVLVLTPVKNAARFLPRYVMLLRRLTYPARLLSVGLLEGDSTDATAALLKRYRPALARRFRRVGVWRKSLGYRLPAGVPRWTAAVQVPRRIAIAKSRNHLLFRALDDEDWVLWIDVDVIDYPPDILERLLRAERPIVTPNCVLEYGGPSFDRNAWRDRGRLHLDDLRGEGDVVRLDTVGGTMLLVRADLHRDGLIFPAFAYGRASPIARRRTPELDTEGFGIMARDMGRQCWGMPNLEIRHAPE
jgi:glycosyltransferase involved in cell wall biosynthesis